MRGVADCPGTPASRTCHIFALHLPSAGTRAFSPFAHVVWTYTHLPQQWLKLHAVHLCLCLKALVGILTEVHEDAMRNRSSSTHACILEAASVFAALLLKDPPQDAQPLLVEAFALSGSVNSDHAVACILSRVTDASLPSPPLLLAAASCAALCGSKFDPHMPVILSKILPCLSVAKSDSTRAVIATLAARFSECAASSRCDHSPPLHVPVAPPTILAGLQAAP